MVEEAGAGDAVDEEVFVLVPGGVVDGAGVVGGDGIVMRSGFLQASSASSPTTVEMTVTLSSGGGKVVRDDALR